MTTIVTRAGKGSALTHNEVDSNFTNLNSAKYESGNNVTFGTIAGTTITASTGFSGALNGTVGASTPAAGTFTSLSDSGNLTFTGTGNRIRGDFSNGTVANRVAFQTSTTNADTFPSFLPNGTSVSAGINIFNNSDPTNAGIAQFRVGSTEVRLASAITGTGTYQPMTFYTGGSERMRIDTSGNVGIGTSSPAQILDVVKSVAAGAVWGSFSNTNATAGSTGGILTSASGANNYSALYNVVGGITYLLGAGAGGLNISTSQAVPIVFNTSASERMRINSSGNVGIGTNAPDVRLDVTGGNATIRGNGTNAYLSLINTFNTAYLAYFGGSTAFDMNNVLNGPVRISTNNTERMRIDGSGNFFLGKSAINYRSVGIQTESSFRTFGLTSNIVNTMWFASREGVTGDFHTFYYNGAIVGNIATNGSTTSYNTSSDYRLKENVKPMTGALAKVAQLKPVTYNWIADGSDGQGFIAHELQEVIPDAVTGEKDALDEKGNPKYQGVDSSFLVATLTAAIQELKAELDVVKAELNTLKGN